MRLHLLMYLRGVSLNRCFAYLPPVDCSVRVTLWYINVQPYDRLTLFADKTRTKRMKAKTKSKQSPNTVQWTVYDDYSIKVDESGVRYIEALGNPCPEKSFQLNDERKHERILNDYIEIKNEQTALFNIRRIGFPVKVPGRDLRLSEVLESAGSMRLLKDFVWTIKNDPGEIGYWISEEIVPVNRAAINSFEQWFIEAAADDDLKQCMESIRDQEESILDCLLRIYSNPATRKKEQTQKVTAKLADIQREIKNTKSNHLFKIAPPANEREMHFVGIYTSFNTIQNRFWLNQSLTEGIPLPLEFHNNYEVIAKEFMRKVLDELLVNVRPSLAWYQTEQGSFDLVDAAKYETPWEAMGLALKKQLMGASKIRSCKNCETPISGRKNKLFCDGDRCRKAYSRRVNSK